MACLHEEQAPIEPRKRLNISPEQLQASADSWLLSVSCSALWKGLSKCRGFGEITDPMHGVQKFLWAQNFGLNGLHVGSVDGRLGGCWVSGKAWSSSDAASRCTLHACIAALQDGDPLIA